MPRKINEKYGMVIDWNGSRAIMDSRLTERKPDLIVCANHITLVSKADLHRWDSKTNGQYRKKDNPWPEQKNLQ